MTTVRVRIHVAASRGISGTAPTTVAPGDYDAVISIKPPRASEPGLRVANLPSHALSWDAGVSLHREGFHDGAVERNGIRLLPVRCADTVVSSDVVNALRDEEP